MRYLKHLLIFFCLAFLPPVVAPIFAQPGEIRFNRISLEEGLSQSVVISIVQDLQGFLWFGTADGLNRFDGYNFEIFRSDPQDPQSLASNGIWRLFRDHLGYIWIGTAAAGLDMMNPLSGTFIHFSADRTGQPALSSNRIRAIYEDRNGNIWVGTNDNGLNRIEFVAERVALGDTTGTDSVRITHFSYQENSAGLSHPSVRAIVEDQEGFLWIGTAGGGLNRLDPKSGEFIHFRHQPQRNASLSTDHIEALLIDRFGNLWIGSDRHGLDFLSLKKFYSNAGSRNGKPGEISFKHPSLKLPGEDRETPVPVRSLHEDRLGNLWIGTWLAGLFKMDPKTGAASHYENNPFNPFSLSHNSVISVGEDAGGVLWFGTNGGGINKYDPVSSQFGYYRKIPGQNHTLSGNYVRAITSDSSGALWVGIYNGGLNRIDPATGQVFQYEHQAEMDGSLSHNDVRALHIDRNNNLWIGTYGGGLNLLESSILSSPGLLNSKFTFEQFRSDGTNRNPDNDFVWTIHEDHNGIIWLGTNEGLNGYDPDKRIFKYYTHQPGNPKSLSHKIVRCIYEDRRGTLWIGTYSGLNRFDRDADTFEVYRHDPQNPNSISQNSVMSIFEDEDGNLWLGTLGGGLNWFDPNSGEFRHFTAKDGLPNNNVLAILGGLPGHLWLSTLNGLSDFGYGRAFAGQHNVEKKILFNNYYVKDGLQSNEFNIGAAHKTQDGTLYFGGINGITYFDPAEISENSHIPQIAITSFKVLDKQRPLIQTSNPESQVQLSHRDNFFSFEFAALDFSNPQQNRYAYRLEGLDRDWVKAGSRRYASYTNVPPGDYIFHVKGSNNHGLWNNKGVRVKISITPPFWQSWWFRSAALLAIMALLYLIYRIRVNHLLAIERTRNEIARDLHDEVSSTISSIVYFSEAIQGRGPDKLPGNVRKYLSLIGEGAGRAQEAMSDIIWSVNPEHDRWDHLIARMRRYASDLLDSKGIRHEIDMPSMANQRSPGMRKQRNLWLIFKEIITNVARHSGCKSVRIILQNQKNSIRIEVEDDGRGFEPAEVRDGNGLRNIKERTKLLDASCELNSKKGRGTRWLIQFPV